MRLNGMPADFLICLSDLYGKNYPIYKFQNICETDKNLYFNDGAYKIIVNSSGARKNLSDDMRALLDYFTKEITESEFTEELSGAVAFARMNNEWKDTYMHNVVNMMDARHEGYQEGMSQGIAQGRAQMQAEVDARDKQIAKLKEMLAKQEKSQKS